MKRLYIHINKHILILCILLAPVVGVGNVIAQSTSNPDGFEANSIGDWVGGGGTESVAMNSSIFRTGSYSLALKTTSTSSNKYWYSNVPYGASANGTYVHFIYWAKAAVASTVDATLRYTGSTPPNGTGTAVTGTATDLSTSAWTRVYFNTGNVSSRWYFPGPRKTTGAATTFYIDDLIIYTSNSEITDIVSPGYALSAIGTTTNGLSWKNGSDSGTGATGIQKTLIFKRTSGTNSSNDLILNNQAIYSLTSTLGPKVVGNWTLVDASIAASATSYNSGTFTLGQEYAIVHRDLAYNYSAPTYVVIKAPVPAISIKEVSSYTTYSSGSTFNMGTLFSTSSVTKTFRIYNSGTGTLNISSCALNSGIKYTTTAPAASVSQGDSTSFTIQFTPGSTSGIFTDVITIANNDTNNPNYTINFTGGKAQFVLPYIYQSGCTAPVMSSSQLTQDYTALSDIPAEMTLGSGAALDASHFYNSYKVFQSEGNCMTNNNSALRIGQGKNALKISLPNCGIITMKWCSNGYRKVKITDNLGNLYEKSPSYLTGYTCYTTQTVVNTPNATTINIEFIGNDTTLLTTLYYLQITPYNASVKSSACNILDFSSGVAGEKVTIYNNVISVKVPAGTDLTTIIPSLIQTSPFASVSPGAGISKDFTNAVSYTVTAQNGLTKTYSVTIDHMLDYGTANYADSIVIPVSMNGGDKKMEIIETANATCQVPVSGNGSNYIIYFLDATDKPISGYQITGPKEVCIGSIATYSLSNAPVSNSPKYIWHLSGVDKSLFTIIGDTISETLRLKAPDVITKTSINFSVNVEFNPSECLFLKGQDTISINVTKDSPDPITGLTASCSYNGILAVTASGSDNATTYNWAFTPSVSVVSQNGSTIVLNIGSTSADIIANVNTQNGCGITVDNTAWNIPYAKEKTTWTGAIDNDWTKTGNWTDRVPKACTNVIIPDVGNGVQYPIIGVSGECHYITFQPGGAVLGLPKLSYVKAFVQMNLQRNKWYTLTAPLKNMYSGDYYFDAAPVAYMRLFDAFNPDSATTGVKYVGTWTKTFSNLAVPLSSSGSGYAFLVSPTEWDYPNGYSLFTADKLVTFPRMNSDSSLVTKMIPYDGLNGRLNPIMAKTVARYDSIAYRFAMEDANNKLHNVTIPIKLGLNLVGNPLMTHLDFNALYASNSSVISNKVKFWNGTTFTTYMAGSAIASSMDLTSTSIAPMQAFFVDGISAGNMVIDLENHFIVDLTTKLRSTKTKANLMYIKTNNGTKQSSTVIALRPNTSNSFGDDDAFKLFTQFNDVPEVYTVADEVALDINQFDTIPYRVPVGLKTTTNGSVNFTFEGAGSFDNIDVTLLNTKTGEEQNLKANNQYTIQYDGNNTDGYMFVEFRKANTSSTSTNEAESCKRCIQVYQKATDLIGVISPANDKIRNITVWEQSGKMLFNKLDINKSSFDAEVHAPKQTCVVRVATENSNYIVKVLMK